MSFTKAASLSELKDAEPLAVTVDDVDVAVVRIECWLHGSTFDMRTGKPTTLPAFEPVPVYPVRVDGDDVLVDVENPVSTSVE